MTDQPGSDTTGAASAAPSPRADTAEPATSPLPCDPVGLAEIAARLGVKPNTAHVWRTRHVMPPPRWTVSGQPAWDWVDIEEWAWATGRILPVDENGT